MANESGLKEEDMSMELDQESCDSSFEIKIKTLDSQTHFFRVNGNMAISALKEEIVTKIGVPLERQRLFYKGKALKDDNLLSELKMEDGDTMHLAERQLETSNNQENSQNTNDIPSNNFHNLSFLQNENERLFIPNALTNISDYINEMEQFLQRHIDFWNDNQSSADWMQLGAHNLPNIDDASTSNHLSFILNRTKQLLRNNVAMDISNLSMYLRRIDSSSNPVLRSYIQYESGRLGATLHQLGAMLLEVGRVTMCLRMGETPEESLVYPGRAAYISRSGPNSSLILLSPLLSIWAWRINQIATMRPQSVPVQLASQVRGSTAGRGDQHHEPGSQRVSPEEAESVQAFGTQSHLATSRSVEQQVLPLLT